MTKMKIKDKNYKKKIIALTLMACVLTTGIVPFISDFLYVDPRNDNELTDSVKVSIPYNPDLPDFLYWDPVDSTYREFNAKGECYILAEVSGTDFTSFILDDTEYEVSYGINIFPIDSQF